MVAATSSGDGPQQPNLQYDIKDMLSMLTGRLTALGRSMASGSSRSQEGGPDAATAATDHGFGIITLAGDNRGASMKANMEDLMDSHGGEYEDENGMSSYANSNYQAVNNSILLGGSCTAEDPGVHIAIFEYIEEENDDDEDDEDDEQEDHEKKKEKKKKKKEKKTKKEKEKEKKKKKKEEKEKSEEESDEEKEKKKKKKKKKDEEEKETEDEK